MSYFEEIKENNWVDLITPRNKLKFHIQRDVYKEEIELELAKISNQSNFNTTSDKIIFLEYVLLKKKKRIAQSREMSVQLIDTIYIKVLQQFDAYGIYLI